MAQGNKIIGQQLASALKALGLSTKDADALAKQGWTVGQVAKGISSAKQAGITKNQPYARGGLVQIGRPGDTGRDTIPLQFGDQAYMVGSGEQAMILNRSQQQFLNARTADVGGLPGMFQRVNRPHYRAQGGFLGRASGGTLSYGQLEGLWDQAGGNPKMAALMAAIAEAESGGNTRAYNPSGASGLWQIMMPLNAGDVPGSVWDPMANAKAAVKILQDQGLGAWSTYTNGAYRAFMHGNVPAIAGGAGAGVSVPTLKAPQIKGTGAIAALAQGVLDQTTAAANKYLTGKASTLGGGAGGNAAFPAGSLPAGVGSYDGKPVDKWIIPILQWAATHGWSGSVTSGYRTDAEQMAAATAYGLSHYPDGPLASNHVKPSYPGGAVDVTDPEQLNAVLRGYPREPNLVWGGPVMEDAVHFSATGHARGGILGRANGGMLRLAGGSGLSSPKKTAPKLTAKQLAYLKQHAKKAGGKRPPAKAHKSKGLRGVSAASSIAQHLNKGVIGRNGPVPFDTSDLGAIRGILSQILALDGGDGNGIGVGAGGDAQRMWDLISWYTETVWPNEPAPNWDDAGDPANFVITTDQYGNDLDPSQYYISPRLNTVISELTKAIGWQGHGVTDLQRVMTLTSGKQLPKEITEAIRRRVQAIIEIRRRVQANAELIRKYKAAIKKLQKRVKETREKMTKGLLYLHPKNESQRQANRQFHNKPYPNLPKVQPYHKPKNAKERAANRTWQQHAAANRTWEAIHNQQNLNWRDQISGWQGQIVGYNSMIRPLESQNKYLAGSPDTIGTKGELGTLKTQLGVKAGSDPLGISQGTASSASGLYNLLDTIQGWRTKIGGVGGDLATQRMTLSGWQSNLVGLAPGASRDLANAIKQATSTGIGTSPDTTTADTTASDTTSQLDSIKAQLYDQLQQAGQVSALQSGAFSPLLTSVGSPTEWIKQAGLIGAIPPYGGSFATGGVVPGMSGEPRTIVAHGGERVVPVGADQPIIVEHHTHNHGSARELTKMIDTRYEIHSRTAARKVSYRLPSAGGGQLGFG